MNPFDRERPSGYGTVKLVVALPEVPLAEAAAETP
jgi:hypothetical protein